LLIADWEENKINDHPATTQSAISNQQSAISNQQSATSNLRHYGNPAAWIDSG
jgi:hypothetical protein